MNTIVLGDVTWAQGAPQRPFTVLPNAGFEHFANDAVELPIYALFAQAAARFGDRLALDDGVVQLTYAEAHTAARRIAATLSGRGESGPVGLLLPNDAWFPIAALACLAAGRPYVPIDLHYPDARNAGIIARAGLRTLLGPDPHVLTQMGLDPGIACLGLAQALLGDGAGFHPAPAAADAPAAILYTSGSTGVPKGIVNPQRALLKRVQQGRNGMQVAAADRVLLLSSPCTIIGTREWMIPLLSGASLHPRDPQTTSLAQLRAAMAAAGITIMFGVPSFLRTLMAAADGVRPFAAMRVLSVGGERVLWDDLALLRQHLPVGCAVRTGYQSTETPCCAWHPPGGLAAGGASVPAGYILEPDVDYAVVDADGANVATGMVGELILRSRYVALGEWQAGGIVPGGIAAGTEDPAQRVFRTGDLVRVAADGLLTVMGRADQQVKVRGQRLELGDLEAFLRRQGGVAAAAVIARPAGADTEIVAFVVPRGAPGDLVAALRRAIRTALPAALAPAAIHLMEALPKLPSGKLDLNALKRYAAPAGPALAEGVVGSEMGRVQDAVAAAWTGLFGRASLLADQSWEEAGGHSLKLLTFVFMLEERLQMRLPLDLFDWRARPSGLADVLQRGGATAVDAPTTLVIMPGLLGDQATLARLRAMVAPGMRVLTIRYPDWAAMSAPGYSFDMLVKQAVQQIGAVGAARLHLIGYSFGGLVAFAAAQRLRDAGGPAPGVLILDSNPRLAQARQSGAYAARLRRFAGWAPWAALAKDVGWRLGTWPLRRPAAAPWVARALGAPRPGAWALPAEWRRRLQSETAQWQRLAFVRAWLRGRAGPDRIPVTLFRSEEVRPGLPDDLGWSALSGPVTIVAVAGDHAGMLSEAHRGALARQILGAL